MIVMTVALMLPLAHAQGDVTLRIDQVDFTAFPQVFLDVTVRDAYGVPIPGLTTADFDVSEDRTLKSRPIVDVRPRVNDQVQIAVVLALDISGSMAGGPLADAQAAAIAFVDRLGSQDQAALLAFADAVNLDAPFPQLDPTREHGFTGDKAALFAVINGLKAGGNTPLYDAAYKAIRLAAGQPPGNRAVLLLTDGRDETLGGPRGSGSKVANEDTPIREANRTNVPVFTIGLGREIDRPYLQRLALETGGTYQETPDSADLTTLFQNVADLLKQQYRLTYQSGVPKDGGMHRVLVSVRHGERVAFDEREWGPAPLEPTPTVTTMPSPTLTPTPTPLPAASAPLPSPGASATASPTGMPPVIAIGGAVLTALAALAAGAAVWVRRRPKPTYCLRCGHRLKPGEPCPYCGASGEYQEPGS